MATRKKVVNENEDEGNVEILQKKTTPRKNLSESYNKFKTYHGKQYTGMQIGRGHHWHYDQGDWKETKITPDLWEVSYAVTKRRAGRAPENSGVPVGTSYQWYILAHQNVTKLNANDYSTELTGLKFKLAHKRADKNKWSAKAPTQRKHLIEFLRSIIEQLEKEPIPLQFEHEGVTYKGDAIPIAETCAEGVCYEAEVTLNDENIGIIRCTKSGWKLDRADPALAEKIGNEIFLHFE
ncbi:hypothetical protein [Dyadobacter sp. BHUBP1]|uniref:hypothetical protein n=1 Tax=Dyadobacter sp. BHUBP1 TaxID=3424178 RepID=UPI003D34D22D